MRWRIIEAAVEQKIMFDTEEVYDNYISKLSGSSYQELDKKYDSGSVIATIRKPYNGCKFLYADVPSEKTDEERKEEIRERITEAMMESGGGKKYIDYVLSSQDSITNKSFLDEVYERVMEYAEGNFKNVTYSHIKKAILNELLSRIVV